MDFSPSSLLYIILCGILLVLSVMMVITCLLVHHKKQLRRLNMEVKQSRVQNRQQMTLGGNLDDGYVRPKSVQHPTIGKKPQPMFHHHSPAFMEHDRPYMNVLKSESDHSYESLDNMMH